MLLLLSVLQRSSPFSKRFAITGISVWERPLGISSLMWRSSLTCTGATVDQRAEQLSQYCVTDQMYIFYVCASVHPWILWLFICMFVSHVLCFVCVDVHECCMQVSFCVCVLHCLYMCQLKFNQLKEKFFFSHIKPYNKDIYDHIQFSPASFLFF